MNANEKAVLKRLNRLRQTRAVYTIGGFALRAAAFAAAAGLAAAFAAARAPWQLRIALLIAWGAAAAAFAVREWKRAGVQRMSQDDIAGSVEDAYPEARSKLLSALQLRSQQERMRQLGYNERWMSLSIQSGFASVQNIRAADVWADERRRALRSAGWAGLAAAAAALALAFGIVSLSDAARWTASPAQAFAWDFAEIAPGDALIQRGEHLQAVVTIDGNAPEPPVIQTRPLGAADDAPWNNLRTEPSGGAHAALIQNISDPLEYRAAVGERASETYAVQIVTPPAVERMNATVRFPAYSGLGVKTLEPDQGDIAALPGSRVEISAAASVPAAAAHIDFQNGDDIPLRIDGSQLHGQFIVQNSDRYRIRIEDAQGTPNSGAPEHILYAVPDENPAVFDLKPGKNADLDRSMTLALEAEASDDFGISMVRLHYSRGGESEAVILARYDAPQPIARVKHLWDLAPLKLFPGDSVAYHIEAFDNDNVNGPKRAVTPTRTARLPSMTEMFNAAAQSGQTQSDLLQSMQNAQEEANEIVAGVIERTRADQQLTLQDEKELQKAVELQKQIEQQRAQLAEEMLQNLKEAEKNDLLSVEALAKIAEMQRLVEEVASEELKEAMRKLQEALERNPLEQREQNLMAANFDQQKFEERIEQMIRALEKMQRRQELEKAYRMAQEIVKRQKQLVEETEEAARQAERTERQPEENAQASGNQEEQTGGQNEQQTGGNEENEEQLERLADQERRIADDSRSLLEQIETAAEALNEDESTQEIAEDLRRSKREAETRELTGKLDESQRELQNRNPQKAQPPASEALGELQRVEQDLDNAAAYMDGEGGEAVLNAMRGALRQTISLSKDQEALMQESAKARRTRPHAAEYDQLALEEKILAEGIAAVADELQELSSEAAQIPLQLFWKLKDAEYAAERSSKAFVESELDRAAPIQREAMAEMNAAALLMIQTLNALNALMNESGAENMLNQLQQLAEGQGDVNDLAEQIEQTLREQGNSPSGEQTLQRIAYEQSLIRQAFQQLEQRMRQAQELAEQLGDVSEEMQEAQSALESGRLDKELLERMRRIETRMLESAKSLEKRQTGKSRKAAVAARIFQDQAGAEQDDWDKIAQSYENAMKEMTEIDAPDRFRNLIRAYYRALSESRSNATPPPDPPPASPAE